MVTGSTQKENPMSSMRKGSSYVIKDIMQREVITTSPSAPVSEAAYLMRNEDIGALVVIDSEEKPVGIVTDRDLVISVLAEKVNPDEVSVGDVMTKDPICVDEDTNIFDIMSMLSEYSIRRLPVTSGEKLIGIVSIDDLIVIVATELVNLSMALSSKSKIL